MLIVVAVTLLVVAVDATKKSTVVMAGGGSEARYPWERGVSNQDSWVLDLWVPRVPVRIQVRYKYD
jgi:hypothetical protein